MWAMGVLTYLLLCGRLPFQGTDDAEMIENIKKVDYSFEADGQQYCIWNNVVTQQAQDFVNNLLNPDTNERMSAVQALAHNWID